MGKEEENSNQGVQNPLYADAESSETSGPGHSNPPEYNQVNQVLQQGNIAPMTILPGQIQVQPGQPQFTSQPQYQYVNQPTYAAQPTQMTAQPTQMIQPGVVQGNAMVQNAPQVVYVQPNPQGLMPTPVQQGQQVVYIQNPDVNRVPGIFDCESPSYFVWFLLGCFCASIASFLTSRKLNEGCSAVRHILPFVTLIVGIICEYLHKCQIDY